VKAHTNSPIPALSLPHELFCHLFQEDRVSFVEVLGLAAVCDGMSGLRRLEVRAWANMPMRS
jgi:hypothetical protein